MLDKADQVYVSMRHDHLSLIGVRPNEIRMSREERTIRRDVDNAVADADTSYFSKVMEANL